MVPEVSLHQLDERLENVEDRLSRVEEGISRIAEGSGSVSGDLSFPEPIAYCLAREQSAAQYHEKFFSLLDAGEACVRYTAALALSFSKQVSDLSTIVQRLRGQPVALGTWAVAIRDSLVCIRDKQPGVAVAIQQSLLGSLLRANGKATSSGRFFLGELIEVRNTEKGHASARPDGVYEELYRRHSSTLHDSLTALGFLRFPLVRIEDVDVAGKYMQYGLRILMGPSPVGHVERIVSPYRVGKAETCVWDRAEALVSLGGLMTYRICPACKLEHTFFLDQAAEKRSRYYSYAGNHRFDAPPFSWADYLAPSQAPTSGEVGS